eukprot:4419354-Pyramimonas_sp.AAC.1
MSEQDVSPLLSRVNTSCCWGANSIHKGKRAQKPLDSNTQYKHIAGSKHKLRTTYLYPGNFPAE